MCRRSSDLARSSSRIRSHSAEPKIGIVSSGMPSGLSGSMSRSQSIRWVESHCLSLPFWYSASSRSRPSSYRQVNRAAPDASMSQVCISVGIVYLMRCLR